MLIQPCAHCVDYYIYKMSLNQYYGKFKAVEFYRKFWIHFMLLSDENYWDKF